MTQTTIDPFADEQESLFPDEPHAAPAATPGSFEAVRAESKWTPPDAVALKQAPLPDLFRMKADLEIRIGHHTADLDAQIVALAPVDGWPGKNAEAREQARAIAMANAPHIAKTQSMLAEESDNLTRVKAEILAREAELDEQKRAMSRLESDIRARDIALRARELDHAMTAFNAIHARQDH